MLVTEAAMQSIGAVLTDFGCPMYEQHLFGCELCDVKYMARASSVITGDEMVSAKA